MKNSLANKYIKIVSFFFLTIIWSEALPSTVATVQQLSRTIIECAEQTDANRRLVCFDSLASEVASTAKKQTKTIVSTSKGAYINASTNDVSKTTESTPAATADLNDSAASSENSRQQSPLSASADTQQQEKNRTLTQPFYQQDTLEAFGMAQKQRKVLEKIKADVSKVIESRFRKTKILLDNGQTWEQQDSKHLRLSKGDKVFIERGILGAFFLGKETQNARMKVKRIN